MRSKKARLGSADSVHAEYARLPHYAFDSLRWNVAQYLLEGDCDKAFNSLVLGERTLEAAHCHIGSLPIEHKWRKSYQTSAVAYGKALNKLQATLKQSCFCKKTLSDDEDTVQKLRRERHRMILARKPGAG